MLTEGLTHTSEVLISPTLTAIAMGSGDLDVYATPAMVALMENAAMKAVKDELDEGYTTVGAHLDISHLRPSKRDKHITATATLVKIDGKKLYFNVEAHEGHYIIGKGTHIRVIVHKERFLQNLQ